MASRRARTWVTRGIQSGDQARDSSAHIRSDRCSVPNTPPSSWPNRTPMGGSFWSRLSSIGGQEGVRRRLGQQPEVARERPPPPLIGVPQQLADDGVGAARRRRERCGPDRPTARAG